MGYIARGIRPEADFPLTDVRHKYFTTCEHDPFMVLRRYIVVSTAGGVLFLVLDALLNANPLARELSAVFQPISRSEINVPAGVFIDLAYGFILAALFLLLYHSLPGTPGIAKGISFCVHALVSQGGDVGALPVDDGCRSGSPPPLPAGYGAF